MAETWARKYGGGPEAGQQMVERTEAVAAEEGLLFRLGEAQRVSTVDAHRVLHLALETGGPALQSALKEELLAAYFLRAENVADHDLLRRTAEKVGLDAESVDAVLGTDALRRRGRADIREAAALGATGVPFFVIDRTYGVSGAQPAEAFTQVLERAWAEAHPPLEHVGCTTDGRLRSGRLPDLRPRESTGSGQPPVDVRGAFCGRRAGFCGRHAERRENSSKIVAETLLRQRVASGIEISHALPPGRAGSLGAEGPHERGNSSR